MELFDQLRKLAKEFEKLTKAGKTNIGLLIELNHLKDRNT